MLSDRFAPVPEPFGMRALATVGVPEFSPLIDGSGDQPYIRVSEAWVDEVL